MKAPRIGQHSRSLTLTCALALASGAAHATNGYFPHGFGLKAKGMGGAAIALAQDGFGGVNNPAATAFANNRLDVGLEVFRPFRDAQFVGMTPVVESGRTVFPIPELGYVRQPGGNLSFGLTVYGNGGMNTRYAPFPNGANLLGGQGKLGVDLMQLIVAPHIAYRIDTRQAIGIAPLLVAQRFEAYGLQAFAGLSSAPQQVTNKGYDTSLGVGVRIGYVGRFNNLSFGFVYSPKTRMERFERYRGLFADGGRFDIPENYGIGFALHPTPSLTLAADLTRVRYGHVPSVGNPSLPPLMMGKPLGHPGGSGFGWSEVDTVKIGIQYKLDESWTVRAGFNRGDNPVQPADAMFNILAPGVTRSHYTAGATWSPSKTQEWTLAAWVAPRESVTGVAVNFATGAANPVGTRISMRQYGVGLQYSRLF